MHCYEDFEEYCDIRYAGEATGEGVIYCAFRDKCTARGAVCTVLQDLLYYAAAPSQTLQGTQ
jgi:hypothetical protein